VRVGRVQRHSPRAKPAVVVVAAAIAVVAAAAAAAVGGWRTRVGGSAKACPADARAVSNRQQETRAHAHGKELMGADVKVIESGQTVGVLELMSHWEGWPRGGQ
jgi:hypothetical protein